MKTPHMVLMLYVVLSLITIIVLSWKVHTLTKQESFCGMCRSIGTCSNRDPELLRALYESGKLTENSPQTVGGKWHDMPWDEFLESEDGSNK